MSRLAPTALALRYLDKSDQWFDLSNARDVALDYVERGRKSLSHYMCEIFRLQCGKKVDTFLLSVMIQTSSSLCQT